MFPPPTSLKPAFGSSGAVAGAELRFGRNHGGEGGIRIRLQTQIQQHARPRMAQKDIKSSGKPVNGSRTDRKTPIAGFGISHFGRKATALRANQAVWSAFGRFTNLCIWFHPTPHLAISCKRQTRSARPMNPSQHRPASTAFPTP